VVGKVDPKERIEVTVRLRPRVEDPEWESRVMAMSDAHPKDRAYLTREELVARRGARLEDIAGVGAFAHAHHLTVVEASVPKRTVRLAGTVADLEEAFGVRLKVYQCGGIAHRGRTGFIYVPAALAPSVEGVFGLDNRPFAQAAYRRTRAVRATVGKKAAGRRATFSVLEIAQHYNFPQDLDGAGQCVGLIELNGADEHGRIAGTGYVVSDLKGFFKKIGKPVPAIEAIGVDHGGNRPGVDRIGDSEVTVDIEVVSAIASGAKIAAYFAPDTDAGFIDVLNAALHDEVRRPGVISVSWGSPEDGATEQFLRALNQVLQDAAALGVTVCCETGDYGSSDQPARSRDGVAHVEFPASSPFALACGGSRLVKAGRVVVHETVWNDGDRGGATGGGVSNKFPRPKYQRTTDVPLSPEGNHGRGLPDVAANAAGYRMFFRGKEFHADGTSVVAPLWAGLITLINQRLTLKGGKPVGFLNPVIYGAEGFAAALRDIREGNNDIDGKHMLYHARPGWDPCTGLGSPDGVKLLQVLAP
jgi:kumamolisin